MSETEEIEERSRRIAGELRRYAQGDLDVPHDDLSRAAALIADSDVLDMMLFAQRGYNRHKGRDDPDFWETEWAQRRIERYASKLATKAVSQGNESQLSYLIGDPSYSNDVSGLHTTRRIEDWLCNSEQCKLVYIAGLMGRGKTDWLLSMFEIIHWHYQRLREEIGEFGGSPDDVPNPEFASNFGMEPEPDGLECQEINNYDDLVEWAEPGNSDMERWFAFDEASTELTAQSGAVAQQVAETFAPFVKKMRKLGVNMIVVGHDRGDVHVAIRSMADFVAKPGLKKATVYEGIRDRKPYGELFSLDNIPETTWGYDTDDMAVWDWGSAVEAIEESDGLNLDRESLKRLLANTAADLVEEQGMTQQQAVETVSRENTGISRYMVQQAIKGEYSEVSAEI